MDYQKLILPTRGRIVNAVYRENVLPTYSGNPLIDALPGILSTEAAIKTLGNYPHYDESMRNLPDEQRYHLLEDIVRFFTPLNVHIDLERRFSRIIRNGYVERNPMKKEFWSKTKEKALSVNADDYDQYGTATEFHSTAATGFNIVGVSGIGKSQAVERIMRLYPQIIHHSKYYERNFTFSQVAWLKLDCPFDGSLKGLCINFFQAIDSLLGTSYHKNYGSHNRTTDEMLPFMALVAANHCLGVLVIDEIQRLSLARSGGSEKMLNFFVQLVNTVGVPVVLVGTYKSLSVFEGNFSQLRRGCGQGDLVWDRMSKNKEWEHFVKALWRFQYTKKVSSLEDNPKLIDVLYEETQGITDLAVKVYKLAQERAIETAVEKIDASIIRSVAKDKFRMLRPALEALKSGQKSALAKFEDAYPQFLGKYLKESKKTPLSAKSLPTIEGKIASSPQIRNIINQTKITGNSTGELPGTSSSITVSQIIKEAVLPKILASVPEVNNKSVYRALSQAGFIRSGMEFNEERRLQQ
jgi:ABC-type dipeptide/oligopeptide/nickel transport system ATPase component